jgi:hypothetical protein
VDADGNRTFREQRRADVTRSEDRHDPAGADAPFQHSGHDAEDEHRKHTVDDAVDPKRTTDEHEERMRRQVLDIGTRDPQDRVVIAGVEQAEHDTANSEQRHINEGERCGPPTREPPTSRHPQGPGLGRREGRQGHHRNLPGVAADLRRKACPATLGKS